MADSGWITATGDQYDDDTNLAARQRTFDYLVHADPLPAPLGDFATLSGLTVLDIGCGNGLFLGQARAGGASAIGLDRSAGMLAAAAGAVPGAPLVRADAVALPVADRSVDVALALWMLYHVADQATAVAELRRVVRPGGLAVAATNSAASSFLDELVCDALSAVLGRPVDAWVHPLPFNAENGAEVLGSGFTDVTEHRVGNRFRITDAEVVVRYVGSALSAIEAVHGPVDQTALLMAVGEGAMARIADRGAVELEQERAVFICR